MAKKSIYVAFFFVCAASLFSPSASMDLVHRSESSLTEEDELIYKVTQGSVSWLEKMRLIQEIKTNETVTQYFNVSESQNNGSTWQQTGVNVSMATWTYLPVAQNNSFDEYIESHVFWTNFTWEEEDINSWFEELGSNDSDILIEGTKLTEMIDDENWISHSISYYGILYERVQMQYGVITLRKDLLIERSTIQKIPYDPGNTPPGEQDEPSIPGFPVALLGTISLLAVVALSVDQLTSRGLMKPSAYHQKHHRA